MYIHIHCNNGKFLLGFMDLNLYLHIKGCYWQILHILQELNKTAHKKIKETKTSKDQARVMDFRVHRLACARSTRFEFWAIALAVWQRQQS